MFELRLHRRHRPGIWHNDSEGDVALLSQLIAAHKAVGNEDGRGGPRKAHCGSGRHSELLEPGPDACVEVVLETVRRRCPLDGTKARGRRGSRRRKLDLSHLRASRGSTNSDRDDLPASMLELDGVTRVARSRSKDRSACTSMKERMSASSAMTWALS